MGENTAKPMKSIEESRMPLVSHVESALASILNEKFGPLVLTFLGSKGMGKTTLLKNIDYHLSQNHIDIVVSWLDINEPIQEQLEGISQRQKADINREKILIVLVDNIDELLRKTKGGSEFFDFERNVILSVIERYRALVIASSQIEINQWSEDDVRVRQVNYRIPALTIEEVSAIASRAGIEPKGIYNLTFGQPQVIRWLVEKPQRSDKELSELASDYFLQGIPYEARQIAEIICLLPVFNAFLLQKILNQDDSQSKVQYLDCLDWLNEYIRRGLIFWDVAIGSFRFTDSAIRRLLARHVYYENPDLFKAIQRIASDYFQTEAQNPAYLHLHLVSAIYHIAQTLIGQTQEKIGDECLKWIREHLTSWSDTSWSEIISAWRNGAGELAVREELIHVMGIESFDLMPQEINKLMQISEVTK